MLKIYKCLNRPGAVKAPEQGARTAARSPSLWVPGEALAQLLSAPRPLASGVKAAAPDTWGALWRPQIPTSSGRLRPGRLRTGPRGRSLLTVLSIPSEQPDEAGAPQQQCDDSTSLSWRTRHPLASYRVGEACR